MVNVELYKKYKPHVNCFKSIFDLDEGPWKFDNKSRRSVQSFDQWEAGLDS